MLPALVALALLIPATAAAQGSKTNAPPGNSAIDEYLETVPAAGGNGIPRPRENNGGTLTRAERNRLEQLGADGRTLAAIIESTAPASTALAPKKQRAERKTDVVALPDAKGRSPITAVLGTAEGDGGMGLLLPAILLASLLTVIALVVLRRRSPS
jgi:hypothetical protein